MSKKTEAIKFRTNGWTYCEISDHLGGIAKSTLSSWLADVPVTYRGKIRLENRKRKLSKKGQLNGANANKRTAKARREHLLNTARKRVTTIPITRETAALIGAALYWAEGTKDRNVFAFSNSDPDMLWFIREWFTTILGVPTEGLRCAVHVYLNNGLSYEEIEAWWSDRLQVPREQFRKPQLNKVPKSSKKKTPRRLLRGTLTLYVCKSQGFKARYHALAERLGASSATFL